MMKKYINAGFYFGIIMFFVYFILSCSKMDDYKSKFMSDGSIHYSGKMDSVNILSGNNRVLLTGLFTSDPNIIKYRVYWNSRQDSIEMPVTRTSGVDTIKLILPNLPEGTMSFEIRTFDAQGNSSVPIYATSTIFGSNYQNSLINRGISDASMQTDGSSLITWADVSSAAGIQYMEVSYKDSYNIQHDTIINSVLVNQKTTLPNYKLGSAFQYKTAYLPNATAIDTFFTAYQSHSVKADVTSVYLSNYGPNFQGTLGSDGRFGILGVPWISNTGAFNKGTGSNTYGGYQHASWQSTGVITWETWNNTPVTDGKIYQITSSPLPAGTYTVSFNYYSEVQQNSSVYVIAAAGNAGIPSLNTISSALGYSALFTGANVGATSPNITETKSFDFTINSPQVVSIGVLGNIIGNGNPGSYFEIRYFKLVQN
jgi:hypothetical protein